MQKRILPKEDIARQAAINNAFAMSIYENINNNNDRTHNYSSDETVDIIQRRVPFNRKMPTSAVAHKAVETLLDEMDR